MTTMSERLGTQMSIFFGTIAVIGGLGLSVYQDSRLLLAKLEADSRIMSGHITGFRLPLASSALPTPLLVAVLDAVGNESLDDSSSLDAYWGTYDDL